MSSARTAATIVLGLVAACTSTPPPTTPTPTPSTPQPSPSTSPAPAPTAVDLVRLGSSCADGVVCPDGIPCVHYYGIAGASGPEFRTCEIQCIEDKTACPAGTRCVTIADGPGAVCRSTED